MKLDLSKFLDSKILINIKFFFIFLIFFATIIHLFFISNDIATLFVLILINISSIIVLNIFFNDLNLKFFFFPSLILFCANLFYFIFPLFFKTILFQSITSNLFLEEKTFYISFLYIMSITIAFKTISSYKDFYYKNENKLFNNFNIFQIPKLQSTQLLFIITLILKLYLAIFDQGINETTNYGDKLMKFFYGFEKFFYLPTIFFFFYYSDNQITKKNFYFFLVINLCFVILFALLKNSRTEIFEYLVIISVLFLILFLYKKIVLTFNKFLIISFFIFLSLIFINNISNKILETRLVRDNVSSLQLLQFYNNSNGIHNNFTENFDPYAIDYTNVSLLNRFTPIAYFDKMLFDLNYFSRTDIRDYQEFLFKKIFAIFPQNFINIFNKNYKKEKFAIANGSYVERVSYNRFGGDFNKGSFIAELLISTQSYFLTFTIIYFLFLSLFYVCIKFQTFKKNELFISPLILFLSFNYIYISQADASFSFMILIFRTPIETIILYYIIQKLMLKYKKS